MKNVLSILLASVFIFGCNSNENSQSDKNITAVVEKSEYELLKEGSTLIGRWKMEFTFGNIKPLTIEFYERDNEYFEVMIEKSANIKKLVKQGEKYLCEKEGEYYLISKNGNLKSYDEEGYIGEEFGFRYVKY